MWMTCFACLHAFDMYRKCAEVFNTGMGRCGGFYRAPLYVTELGHNWENWCNANEWYLHEYHGWQHECGIHFVKQYVIEWQMPRKRLASKLPSGLPSRNTEKQKHIWCACMRKDVVDTEKEGRGTFLLSGRKLYFTKQDSKHNSKPATQCCNRTLQSENHNPWWTTKTQPAKWAEQDHGTLLLPNMFDAWTWWRPQQYKVKVLSETLHYWSGSNLQQQQT